MKPGKKLKLEDILGNDRVPPFKSEDPAQQELANAVQRVIRNAGNETWDPADKAALWQQIAPGLAPKPVIRRYLFLKAAAIALVLLSAGAWWLWPRQQSALVQFARRQPAETVTETRLTLGQNKSVVIKGKNSVLVYARNSVSINADSTAVPSSPYNTLLVPYGRRSRVQLEDGTIVQLNAGSRLVYPAVFTAGRREVYLEGEGFFDIAPDAQRPFFVYASGMETEVLGTTFNISAYPDDSLKTLVLASGSVRLHLEKHGLFGQQPQQLKPAEMATISREGNQLRVSRVNVAAYTAWKDGRLLFAATPLKDILKKLTRYYNIRLDLESTQPGLETCSGDLDLEDNLDNVLDVICATNSLRYERHGQRIILKEKE